jgi:hypothetical protein
MPLRLDGGSGNWPNETDQHSMTREQGRDLLQSLLPWAREEAERLRSSGEIYIGALARAQVAYVTEENLEALVIYEAPEGGWHADVVLKEVPSGVPNCFGSPTEDPLPTYDAAMEIGKKTLVMLLVLAATDMEAGPPVFILDGNVFELSVDILAWAHGYGSPERAAERLKVYLAAHFRDGAFDGPAYLALPRNDRNQLLTILHMAAVDGLFRYPCERPTIH